MDKTHQTMNLRKKKAHYDKGHLQKNKNFKKLLNIILNGETLSISSLKYRRIARMFPLIILDIEIKFHLVQ